MSSSYTLPVLSATADDDKTPKFILPVFYRAANISDIPFIYASWINSLQNCYPFNKLEKNFFCRTLHSFISYLLATKGIQVTLATNPDDTDQCYGYCVYSTGVEQCSTSSSAARKHFSGASTSNSKYVLYWIYTKLDFRKTHVATQLIDYCFNTSPIHYCIHNRTIEYHLKRWNLVYSPELLSINK